MDIEQVKVRIRERITFAANKLMEGVGTTETDPVFWEAYWKGQIQALQNLSNDIWRGK